MFGNWQSHLTKGQRQVHMKTFSQVNLYCAVTHHPSEGLCHSGYSIEVNWLRFFIPTKKPTMLNTISIHHKATVRCNMELVFQNQKNHHHSDSWGFVFCWWKMHHTNFIEKDTSTQSTWREHQVLVCVCARARTHTHTHTQSLSLSLSLHIHTYMRMHKAHGRDNPCIWMSSFYVHESPRHNHTYITDA